MKYPTHELTLHPSRNLLPGVDTQSDTFKALLNLIATGGFAATGRHIVTHSCRIIEGADLWEAAKLIGLVAVETVEVAAEHIESVMLAGLVAREHYTKGQIAFLVYPLLQPMFDRVKSRKLANLKKGSNSSQVLEIPDPALSAGSGNPAATLFGIGADKLTKATTIPQVADALGISERLFRMAGQLHKEFAADPDLAAQFIPQILAQDESGAAFGLGGIIAGIAGRKATKDITPIISPELDLWGERITKWTAPARWAGWDKLTPEHREAVSTRTAEELLKTSPEEVIAAIHRRVAADLGIPYRPNLKVV